MKVTRIGKIIHHIDGTITITEFTFEQDPHDSGIYWDECMRLAMEAASDLPEAHIYQGSD